MNSKHEAQIKRWEASAARNPALYRLRLSALAIGGDVLLTTAQIAPWVLPLAIGVLILNSPLFYWIGAALLVFFIYLFRPTLRMWGRPVTRAEAPVLFAEIDALRDKLQVGRRMEVMLDDSINAGALETRGLFGLMGKRRVLFLGVPLLAVLPRDQILAIIAHEFGHFSRRHGRLGHWLYRARAGWIEFAREIRHSDLVLDKSVAWLAETLIPYFSRISFGHARHCEYEADADAASASGSRVVAEALTRVMVMARLWDDGFPRALARLRQTAPDAPGDYLVRFTSAAASWPAAEIEQWRMEALDEKPNWLDTHPRRIAALREASQPVLPAGGAGPELLGTAWPVAIEDFNDKWRQRAEWNWAFEHLRFKEMLAPLLAHESATLPELPLQDRLARAVALRAVAPADGLAELRALREQHPEEPSVTFAYGSALLDEGNTDGVSLLENLAIARPTFRVPVYERLVTYFRRTDGEEGERWTGRLQGAANRRVAALTPFVEKLEDGRANPSTLAPPALAVLVGALARDPCVERAWLFEGREKLATAENAYAADLDMHALVITLDPEALSHAGEDQDAEENRYSDALGALVPANAEMVVRSYFTTQAVPAILDSLPTVFDRRTQQA